MACYLAFTDEPRECAGCSQRIPPGLVGFTDEIEPGALRPVCSPCLDGLDARLRGAQKVVRKAGRALLDMPE